MENKKAKLEQIIRANLQKDHTGRRDLISIYKDRENLKEIVSYLADAFKNLETPVDYVASPESLGFILGSMVADELGVGFIPIRNTSVYPVSDEDVIRASYIDHRDRSRALQVRKGSIPKKSRILLVDDWVETAVTMLACVTIVEESDSTVVGIAALGTGSHKLVKGLIEERKVVSILSE